MAEAARPMIGDPQHLAFEVSWPAREPAEVRGLGWGELTLWCAGRSIWASGAAKRPVSWTWIDLIEHMARAWGYLLYEEVFPFGLVASRPEDLRAKWRITSVRGKTPTEVEDAVHAFQHRHDLAAALKGVQLPSIWLLREGTQMRVSTQGHDLWRPWNEIVATLEKLVDTIRARVSAPALRAKLAFERWDARAPGDELVTRLRTGLSREQLVRWAPTGVRNPMAWWGLADVGPKLSSPARARRGSERQTGGHSPRDAIQTPRDTSLMAVARLSQSLEEETRIHLVRAISAVALGKTPVLDELTTAASAVLDAVAEQKPFSQGYVLALWLRAKLAIADDSKVDPAVLLEQWGVTIQELPPLESALDAVACWGDRGPAVLINPGGRHASSPAGRATNLAHEIAHLIMDRDRALPLAEVFGGATPLHLEQRARAFAAELLLPREIARIAVTRAPSLARAANQLQHDYGVSREVIGWQVKNGEGWTSLRLEEQRQIQRWVR